MAVYYQLTKEVECYTHLPERVDTLLPGKPTRPGGSPLRRRGICSSTFLRTFSIIKVEKRYADEGLRCLAETPFALPLKAKEWEAVGGQILNKV